MGERQTTQTAQIAPSSSAVATSVARQAGSIGYISASALDTLVQTMKVDGIEPTQANIYQNTYPLRTTLFFAGPGEPADDLRAFIAWVQSPDGQAIVARHYAPLANLS
jgi:phosphate transport system substrate-binding protein